MIGYIEESCWVGDVEIWLMVHEVVLQKAFDGFTHSLQAEETLGIAFPLSTALRQPDVTKSASISISQYPEPAIMWPMMFR